MRALLFHNSKAGDGHPNPDDLVAALKKVEGEILKDHISHCVEHAIKSGDKKAQREKVQELVQTLARARNL